MKNRKNTNLPLYLLVLFICLNFGFNVQAEIRLANGFSSGMVLQRDQTAWIAGYADVGEEVTVRLGEEVVGQTKGLGQGQLWRINLPVFKAGAIANITVTGKNELTLTDLLAGDVWICSGQSNMDMSVSRGPWCAYGGVFNEAEEVKAADYPQIRLFVSPGKEGWATCRPESVKSFSAAGYFFGRHLHKELDVPIGLIQAAIGGTPAEYWTPRSAREAWVGFKDELESAQKVLRELKPIFDADRKAWADWRKLSLHAQKEGLPVPDAPTAKLTDEQNDEVSAAIHVNTTGQGYAARVKPLTSMAIKGVIWYQGEANVGRAHSYVELMRQLMTGWRSDWGLPELPFVIMQLVNFDNGGGKWPELRAAQETVINSVPGTSIAIGIDIGEAKNIHPKNKQDVGKRLALAALKNVYEKDLVSSGPTVKLAGFDDGKITIAFDPGGQGQKLVFHQEKVSGFEMAAADGKFAPASVEQKGNTLVLTSPEVSAPQTVRYAWSDNPLATLFNTAGLPAAPFQTRNAGIRRSQSAP